MNIRDYHNVYFIGIGGIGMSALARWFRAEGYAVAGYDRTETPLTTRLSEEGILVHYDDRVASIPTGFTNKDRTLVVYTPAIPADHEGYNYFVYSGFDVVKRSRVLGCITEKYFSIAVAGTHGKTTTSAILAHLIRHAGRNCLGFIGGMMQNYASNLLLSSGEDEEPIAVVEADEYDRSFLQLQPDIAVVTSVEPDHLDIYKTKEVLRETFGEFVGKIKSGGVLICHEDTGLQDLRHDIKNIVYGTKNGDLQANSIRAEGDAFTYDVVLPARVLLSSLRLSMPGRHNVLNSLGALAAALEVGIPGETLREGMAAFTGVKRRFEYVVKNDRVVYIDDYAHHPSEIAAALETVRMLYPGKEVTVVFQPHLYSRTRDFMDEFGKSLSRADDVVLLDIYPAREQPISGVTSEKLLEKIAASRKQHLSKEDAVAYIGATQPEVLLTLGAGDIDRLTDAIKHALEKDTTHEENHTG